MTTAAGPTADAPGRVVTDVVGTCTGSTFAEFRTRDDDLAILVIRPGAVRPAPRPS